MHDDEKNLQQSYHSMKSRLASQTFNGREDYADTACSDEYSHSEIGDDRLEEVIKAPGFTGLSTSLTQDSASPLIRQKKSSRLAKN